MSGVAVIFFVAAFYFYRQRDKVSFLTRSPLAVTLSLFMLGVDAMLNTLQFSSIRKGNFLKWHCDIGIIATVIGQFGFMLATAIRIYRISKVYNKYLSYLEIQK